MKSVTFKDKNVVKSNDLIAWLYSCIRNMLNINRMNHGNSSKNDILMNAYYIRFIIIIIILIRTRILKRASATDKYYFTRL